MANNRRIEYKNKDMLLGGILLVVIAFICTFFVSKAAVNPSHSKIQKFTQQFIDTGSVENPPEVTEGMPEDLFIKGLIAYAEDDFDTALTYFTESEKSVEVASDPALVPYLYCFLNSSLVATTGEGDIDYVKAGLSAMADYPVAANNHDLVYKSVISVAFDEETDAIAIDLLQNILDQAGNHLSDDARLHYANTIATFYFIDGNYSESIRRFYDIKSEFANAKNPSPSYQRQMGLNNFYIAGFYFELEDYETAAKLFEENIAFPIEDKDTNADVKYSDYINLSSAYIELGKVDEAEEVVERMHDIFPYLDPDLVVDVEASLYDNMAQCEIIKGDYKKAEEYIAASRKKLGEVGDNAFYGSEEFLRLTEAKLLIAKKEYEEARIQLEELLDSPQAVYAGLEKSIYELLSDVYEALGDKDAYIKNREALLDYNKDFSETIRAGYLEFSRYYDEAESAKRINTILREREQLTFAVIITVSVTLFIILILLINIRNSGYIDSLTGIKNRKALHNLYKKYQSAGLPKDSAIIMVDIDFFKQYNDFYGHLKGDEVLKSVAHAMQRAIRKKDFLIRFGGEEFLVFIEHAGNMSYESICERLRSSIEELKIPHEKSEVNSFVTISLGLCINTTEGEKMDDILLSADEALYEAKHAGRNRFVISRV